MNGHNEKNTKTTHPTESDLVLSIIYTNSQSQCLQMLKD